MKKCTGAYLELLSFLTPVSFTLVRGTTVVSEFWSYPVCMQPRNILFLSYGLPLLIVYVMIVFMTIRNRRLLSTTFALIFTISAASVNHFTQNRKIPIFLEPIILFHIVGRQSTENRTSLCVLLQNGSGRQLYSLQVSHCSEMSKTDFSDAFDRVFLPH